ncbi:hypothetical protein [Agrococcus sp. DT81.2]|uniref:hypothetical protein n=1 Tax=Agrococcus sp. DT81.2 TaxID=3393414 RepID=UPI003CE5AAF5
MPQWTHQIVDTKSGTRLTNVDVADWPYQTLANTAGQGTCDVVVRGSGLTKSDWDDLLRPRDRTIVHSLDGFAMYAGLIERETWDGASGVSKVASIEMRAMASRRYPFSVPTYNAGFAFDVSGKSWRGIARAIVKAGFHSIPGDSFHLPIILPADEAGTQSKHEPWNEFKLVEDLLREVQDRDGGPDIYFDPVWSSSGKLEWWLKIGSPRLDGPTFESRATGSYIDGLKVIVDGSKQLTGVFGIGSGQGHRRVVGKAGSIAGPSIPDMDAPVSFTKVDVQSEADSLAMAHLKAHRTATTAWSFDMVMDGSWAPHELRPGSTVRIWHDGDERVAAGWRDEYVTSVSGGPSEVMRVGVR